MKFMLQDDMLEIRSIESYEQFSVKFYRTVQRPYTQNINISTVYHRTNTTTGNMETRKTTHTVKAQAIIMELSNNRIVFKVDVFDHARNVYKLFFQSEFNLDESKKQIMNKERTSNILNLEYANQASGPTCGCHCVEYCEYEIVTLYGYST